MVVERHQKEAFADTLCGIIVGNEINLIAEEGKLDRDNLGNRLAKEFTVRRVELTMPIKEREKRGIHTPQYDRDEKTRLIAYAAFEEYMFAQVKAARATRVLVICGRRHLLGLERLFAAAGDDVRVYDINRYPWYLGIPMESPDGIAGYRREG